MSLIISEYPRRTLGHIAAANGMTSADGPWIAGREASGITGIPTKVLARWEEAGVISALQNVENAPRLYLRPEMEALAELGTAGPPNLPAVRRYLKKREEAGVSAR